MTRIVGKTVLLVSGGRLFNDLAEPLRQVGFNVVFGEDGAKALDQALQNTPDLIILDTAVPVLGSTQLVDILRNNQRTFDAMIFFVGLEGEELSGFRESSDRFIPKPFNTEQLLVEIRSLYLNKNRKAQLGQAKKEVEGDLQQISLSDLLQVFAMNRKDGVLAVTSDRTNGYIFVSAGHVINSRIGQIEGAKAFYRLLMWDQGKFRFTPGQPQTEVKIQMTTDQLLMEGMRQNDEMRAQMSTFPAAETLVDLVVSAEQLPEGLRAATLEIITDLSVHPRVADLVENSPLPDYEVLQILRTLIEKKIIRVQKRVPDETTSVEALLQLDEVLAIKSFLGDVATVNDDMAAKLILLATCDREVGLFLQSLQGIDEFEPESDFLRGAGELTLGDVGRLEIGGHFHLRLFVLPATDESAPLWRPFCHHLFGVLSLAEDDRILAAENYFLESMHAPVAKNRDNKQFSGVLPLRRGDRHGLCRLLRFFASHFTGKADI
jgi:CheY-like chemotaxis protein